MEMVGHHTKSLKNPARLFTRLKKTGFKGLVRPLVNKKVAAVIATVDHVIHPALSLDSQTPRHQQMSEQS